MPSTRRFAMLAALLFAACGEEDEGPPPKAGGQAAAPRGAGRAAGVVSGTTLEVFKQIESLAVDEKEAKSLRHAFRETDFQIDPTGTVNRDPFRSFVINQPGVSATGDAAITAEPTELCPRKKQIASTYAARELKLVGIVAKGTTRWALFSDTAQRGHIVHRNDCVGREKGRVIEIGATYAKAEVSPEVLPNQQPRPAEIITYLLHPQQLPLGDDIDEITADDPRPRGRGDSKFTAPPATKGNAQPL